MPRSALGWLLTLAVPALAIALAFLAAGGGQDGGASGPDATAQAAAVCERAHGELKRLSGSPQSVPAALEMEHRLLAIIGRELTGLEALAPELSSSFQAGLADDRSLLRGMNAMVARPDFVHLSLTLPGHPELVPAWMKAWLAREQALQRDAQRQFSHAGITACEASLAS